MRPVNWRLLTHIAGSAPWTLGGWPISMIVVWMKPSRMHVAAHAAHRDAVADREGRAAQDDEVAGDRR